MLSRILIANRGEIALRIIRACRELGIETVLVHSTADSGAEYLKFADETICIGPSPSAQSYLDVPSIISAAEITDVEAIHPGYGFLAENSHFAEVCRSCHIEFIGPSPETIDMMGDKSKARDVAKEAGISLTPGSDGPVRDENEGLQIAHQIGFPVMIKAAGGGGGRGMRVARNDVSFMNGFLAARAEAAAAFGNPTLYIEKLIESARHVEVQVLADRFGKTIHLGERDCTVQRRHQKLIEEAPCPVLTAEQRRAIGEDAVKVARAANYENAGTVEFLLDANGNHYFMEMNTRIQVEHPVTEMVTGIDLVKEQIRIASGEPLTFSQDDVRMNGVAIECRINAEDPYNGFKPCPGRITHFVPPGGFGVRWDSHVYAGYTVPPTYDSMVGKLIVHKPTREEAIRAMRAALDQLIIEGIKTTIPFLSEVLENVDFVRNTYDTAFLESKVMVAKT